MSSNMLLVTKLEKKNEIKMETDTIQSFAGYLSRGLVFKMHTVYCDHNVWFNSGREPLFHVVHSLDPRLLSSL